MRDRGLIPDRGKKFMYSSKSQDCYGGHLASYSMGTGSFLPGSKDSVASTYPYRVPNLMLNAVHFHSPMPLWRTQGHSYLYSFLRHNNVRFDFK
jgi:hypothetical protein